MGNERLTSLIDGFLEDRLTPSTLAELRQLLLSSPGAREEFDRFMSALAQQFPDLSFPTATELIHDELKTFSPVPPSGGDVRELFSFACSTWRRGMAFGGVFLFLLLATFAIYESTRRVPLYTVPVARAF